MGNLVQISVSGLAWTDKMRESRTPLENGVGKQIAVPVTEVTKVPKAGNSRAEFIACFRGGGNLSCEMSHSLSDTDSANIS